MTRIAPRTFLGLVLVVGLVWPSLAADETKPDDKKKPDLSEYKTLDKATPAVVKQGGPVALGQSGYLGVHVAQGPQGKVVVVEVAPDSPAAKAGLQPDDVILKVGGQEVRNPNIFRETLLAHRPGEEVKLAIVRKEKPQEITAKLGATSKPLGGPRPGPLAAPTPTFGLTIDEIKEGEGGVITRVIAESPAAKVGFKVGEIVMKIDGQPISDASKVGNTISEKRPGDVVTLTMKRDGKPVEVQVTLGSDGPDARGNAGVWQKPVYRLGVICIEFLDTKHNDKIAIKDWEESLFSRNTYRSKNSVTGQPVYGSVADYFHEVSGGALKVEGKVFNWIEAKRNRMEYAPGNGTGVRDKTALLNEVLDKLAAREGQNALKDFDGLCFIYSGSRAATNAGSLYWPHRGSFRHGNKTWAYMIANEGGMRMTNISTFCPPFGQLLGLPQLSARSEVPNSRGAGPWCMMANTLDTGKPQHLCAWSKEQLGWIRPTVLDPTVKQKLILAPIEGSKRECYKVLVKLDGSEYLLLENRAKKGYDGDLPGEGLLIWRVVNNKPILEEAHGVEGSSSRTLVGAAPYPSAANDSFTPKTTPSSQSQLGGGLPVHLTNIRKLPDGRITFHIGYEYQ